MDIISRRFLFSRAASLGFVLRAAAQEQPRDPWTAAQSMEPAELAKALQSGASKPTIISVVFPVLYRQRHIAGALQAGPASKPEGLAFLKHTVATMPKDRPIVVYCGCCPMEHCPNIRPAYTLLEQLGFHQVRVLQLRTNLHTDWTAKGYPVA